MIVKRADRSLTRAANGDDKLSDAFNMFERCARASIRYPWRALIIGVGCALIMVSGLFRLGLRTDAQALVDPLAPEVALNKSVQERFGLVDPIVVIIRSTTPEGIFNPPTLRRVKSLTERLPHLLPSSAIPVVSLATVPGLRMRSGTMEPELLLERERSTKSECAELRDDLRRIQLYNGTLLARDERSTAIFVSPPARTDRAVFHQSLRQFLQREAWLRSSVQAGIENLLRPRRDGWRPPGERRGRRIRQPRQCSVGR